MGWNFDTTDWAAATGALFPGGESAPAFWTIVAIIACVVVLWVGNRTEHDKYKDHE